MAKKPYTLWFAHADGRWREIVLEDFQQLHLPSGQDDHPGGLYIGSDPTCDVVLDGDDVERFHALYYGRGHHTFFELIAGRVHADGGHPLETLHPGDSIRGGFPIGGWQLTSEARVDERRGEPAVRAALMAARDARLAGRAAEAAAILAQIGGARVEVAPRTAIPAPLAQAAGVLRIRVEDTTGATEVHALGSIERLARGVTIGADPDCDLVLPTAGPNRVALVRRKQLFLEVHAGTAGPMDSSGQSRPIPAGERTELTRWRRIQVGGAIIQLCRWPGRHEPLR